MWSALRYKSGPPAKRVVPTNAIKISKKTPGTSGKTVPGGIFLHYFAWDIAQITAVSLNLMKIKKQSIKLRNFWGCPK
jgi:hypothetical protein